MFPLRQRSLQLLIMEATNKTVDITAPIFAKMQKAIEIVSEYTSKPLSLNCLFAAPRESSIMCIHFCKVALDQDTHEFLSELLKTVNVMYSSKYESLCIDFDTLNNSNSI